MNKPGSIKCVKGRVDMLKLDVSKLVRTVSALDAYADPLENQCGVKYLHETLFTPLSNDQTLWLSDIDFNSFTLDDLEELEDYYHNTLIKHQRVAYHVCECMRKASPAVAKLSFI